MTMKRTMKVKMPKGGGEAPKALSARVLVAAYWLFVVLNFIIIIIIQTMIMIIIIIQTMIIIITMINMKIDRC